MAKKWGKKAFITNNKKMQNIKKDFPVFTNNKNLVFLDSTASTQKPSLVIDGIKEYLENDYSNIHRWAYSLAERSEKMYEDSKKKMAEFLNADSWREVIYSFNSTYASNLLITSIRRSWLLRKGDKVLVSIVEHHANVVPWLILKEELWIEVEYVKVNKDYSLDFEDLEEKLQDPKVKIVSMTHVSNVTWEIFDLERVGEMVKKSLSPPSSPLEGGRNERLFIIDASQSFPHMKVDVKKLQCDALFFTGHKFGADSGIGVLWWKTKFLENLKPWLSGGWAISWVKQKCFKEAKLPDRFEPWTPNLSWAVSLLKALEYIESIWWYEEIEKIEQEQIKYFLEKLEEFKFADKFSLIWSTNTKTRAAVFSFNIEGIHPHDVADYLAENDICIRAGQHCAEPFMGELWISGSCRVSFWIYNDEHDIDRFFEVLWECIDMFW